MNMYKLTSEQFVQVWETLEQQPEFFQYPEQDHGRMIAFRAKQLDNQIVAMAVYTGPPPRTGHYFATDLACNEAGINPEGT